MIRRPPRSTQSRSSAASDVYKRQYQELTVFLLAPRYFTQNQKHFPSNSRRPANRQASARRSGSRFSHELISHSTNSANLRPYLQVLQVGHLSSSARPFFFFTLRNFGNCTRVYTGHLFRLNVAAAAQTQLTSSPAILRRVPGVRQYYKLSDIYTEIVFHVTATGANQVN